jgi:hypothetical protein
VNLFAHLRALDAALVEKGFPALTAWWLETLRTFLESRKRQAVLRVGRRGGKSTSLVRVLVVLALFGDHVIPRGDVGVVAIISVNKDEAAQRLRLVKAILDAIGARWRPIDGGIELVDRPIAFKVYTASIAGVSGFTCIGALCDEVAKWKDSDTGANPASEVLVSLRPTMAGQPGARLFLSSSPLGALDAHAAAFAEGETNFQSVAHAATWIARPNLTEAETRALEPDDLKHRREYAAIPLEESESSVFASVLLDRATRRESVIAPQPGHTYVATMDPALRGDAWTFIIATARYVGEVLKRSVVLAREWRGTPARPLDPNAVLSEIARLGRSYGIDSVVTDQHSSDALRAIALRHGLSLVLESTTAASKLRMYEGLGSRISDDEVEIPPDPILRGDLLAVRKRLTPNGFTIELPRSGGRHADFAPAVALAVERAFIAPRTSPGHGRTWWTPPEDRAPDPDATAEGSWMRQAARGERPSFSTPTRDDPRRERGMRALGGLR